MTLGEIYTRVMWMLYGDTNYPQSTQQHMTATSQGIILDAHKAVQQNYDYWFMEAYKTYERTSGQTTFILPDDFKTVKNVRVFTVRDKIMDSDTVTIDTDGSISGFSDIVPEYGYNLTAVKLDTYWFIVSSVNGDMLYTRYTGVQSLGGGELYRIDLKEIPMRKQIATHYGHDVFQNSCFAVEQNRLHIYSKAINTEIVELFYYKYYSFTGTADMFALYEDPITENAYNAIIYLAVEMEERRRREYQAAMYYRKLAEDAIAQLKREHVQRRNTNTLMYTGGW